MTDKKRKAITVGPEGFDYKLIARLLFDPSFEFPLLAMPTHEELDKAEDDGVTHFQFTFSAIGKEPLAGTKTAGYHKRELEVPISVMRALASIDPEEYARDRRSKGM